MNFKSLLLVSTSMLVVAANANLVSNGDFEQSFSGADISGSGYWTFNAGNAGIPSWTVGMTSVDIVDSTYAPYAGAYALDLAGTPGPGSISQTLATDAGTQYTISFVGRYTGDPINQIVNVGFDGGNQQFSLTGTDTTYSFDATASTASTLLSLATDPSNSSNGNLFIDNVSVQAVPEPTGFALFGLGALGLLRRRNSR